jgi:HPt (histidine-containing phosphotransfer) domain-containing protein
MKKLIKNPTLNWDFINTIFQDDIDQSHLFIKNYIHNILEQLELLQAALHQQDLQKVKEVFHSLKGSSNIIIGLQNRCIDAEKSIQDLDWSNLNIIYKHLKNEIEILKIELNNL